MLIRDGVGISPTPRPGRVVKDIPTREPFPRSEAFRGSPAFSLYARQLQDSLLHASQSGMES